ncbi:transcriptional repressor TUP1 [Planoprotostelium fungivorum]|uniref:Transcriptional repressor TUP1 n=1 Tax=Planoprotostelium fungivorum TaxID=1890364 RepID=A0A2P6MSG1_9EUKA|nr:transcriptional repressor TUP1 [Planoprotostelium fungivorum]
MYAPHPPRQVPVAGRIAEQLENLKSDFDTIINEHNMYKVQRDELERKVTSQVGELSTIQQTIYELQQAHAKIKAQYEEEIHRLRRQLELGPGGPAPYSAGIAAPIPSLHMPGVGVPGAAPSPQSRPPTGPTIPPPDKGIMSGAPGGMFYPPMSGPSAADAAKRGSPFQPTGPSMNPLPITNKRTREEPYAYPVPAEISEEKFTPKPPARAEPVEVKDEGAPKMKTGNSSTSNGQGEDGLDWMVGYNSGVQTNLNIDLSHNLDHSSVVCCVRFSNDGKHLATGCNKSAQIYDVQTGEKVYTFSEDPGKDGDLYIRSVCFSPDNKFLAVGAEDKTVKVWDVENRCMHHTFAGHGSDIYSLDFSRDGNLIVSGSGDQKAKIWDLKKQECVFTLGNDEVGPKDGVTSVAFSPDGRLVAAGSLDRIVRVWDTTSGYFLERYEGHLDSVYSVAFSRDGKTLASGSLDKTLKLWDITGGGKGRSRCRSTFTGHKDYVLSVAFSPDGNWLISGSKDRSVQFWDPRSAITHMMLQGHKNSVISVAVSPTGKHFATGSGDCRARLWRFFLN